VGERVDLMMGIKYNRLERLGDGGGFVDAALRWLGVSLSWKNIDMLVVLTFRNCFLRVSVESQGMGKVTWNGMNLSLIRPVPTLSQTVSELAIFKVLSEYRIHAMRESCLLES
jgi:hypothetical protein